MAQRIIVTDAGGYLASCFIQCLLESGSHVSATCCPLDRQIVSQRLVAMKATASSPAILDQIPGSFEELCVRADTADVIFHMSNLDARLPGDDSGTLADHAIAQTLAVLKAAALSDRTHRVVLTSSAAAMLDPADGPNLDSSSRKRICSDPNSHIGAQLLAEQAAWNFMDTVLPDFDLVVLSPFQTSGRASTQGSAAMSEMALTSLPDVLNSRIDTPDIVGWHTIQMPDLLDAHMIAIDTEFTNGRFLCAVGRGNLPAMLEEAHTLDAEVREAIAATIGEDAAKSTSLGFEVTLSLSDDALEPVRELGIQFRANTDCFTETLRTLLLHPGDIANFEAQATATRH